MRSQEGRRTTASSHSIRRIALRTSSLVGALVVALGLVIGGGGTATAISCEQVSLQIAYHNAHPPDRTNHAAVDRYNAEAERLNMLKHNCTRY